MRTFVSLITLIIFTLSIYANTLIVKIPESHIVNYFSVVHSYNGQKKVFIETFFYRNSLKIYSENVKDVPEYITDIHIIKDKVQYPKIEYIKN